MYKLALGLVYVALGTLLRRSILVEWNRMDAGENHTRTGEKSPPHEDPYYSGHKCLQGLRTLVHG